MQPGLCHILLFLLYIAPAFHTILFGAAVFVDRFHNVIIGPIIGADIGKLGQFLLMVIDIILVCTASQHPVGDGRHPRPGDGAVRQLRIA